MCMQCVAGSAPYVSVGFALLRGRAIKDWVQVRRRSSGPAQDAPRPVVVPTDERVTTPQVDERDDELVPLG